MDCVFLQGLVCQARVGVLSWEKMVTQTIQVDCSCYLDSCQEAVVNNDLSATLDYAAMREAVLTLVAEAHYDLLETLAESIVSRLFDLSDLTQRVVVTVKKTTIFPDTEAAGVRLDRLK